MNECHISCTGRGYLQAIPMWSLGPGSRGSSSPEFHTGSLCRFGNHKERDGWFLDLDLNFDAI